MSANWNSGGGVPRPRLLLGLLVVVLLLVLGLSWQAMHTARQQADVASGVLRDYARLAVDEYARRATAAIGYYGYYSLINALKTAPPADDGQPAINAEPASQAARAEALASVVFAVGDDDVVHATTPVTPAMRDAIVAVAGRFAAAPEPEAGFTIDHPVVDGVEETIVIANSTASPDVIGFIVDRDALSLRLLDAMQRNPLLPQSLATDEVANEHLYLAHADTRGAMLLEQGTSAGPALTSHRDMNDEYGGIFRGHRFSASIDPAIAGSLIIGGLPAARLPYLAAIIAITIGLIIATILQLRNEYALMKLRSDFVAEVSHELRTPLTQIRMFAETLSLERYRSDDDRRRALEIINRETRRLIHLVENVLRFSRGNGRELELRDHGLAPLLTDVVNEFRPLAAGAGMSVVVEADSDVSAICDTDSLRQMLLNLLDNAVKYGPAGQTITVSAAVSGAVASIAVADEGPGIPGDLQDSVWKPYRRLERDRRSAIAGAGIGLAVVRELAEAQGGTATVENLQPAGARFVVELPLGKERTS